MTHDELWHELETAPAGVAEGLVRRPIEPDSTCNLYLAASIPGRRRMLVMVLKSITAGAIGDLPITRGIETRLISGDRVTGETRIELTLTDPRYASIFTALVGNIVQTVAPSTSEQQCVSALLGQLNRWARFLEHVGPEGLTRWEQQGLYGELWFLRRHLLPLIGARSAIFSWRGPSGAQQDYQLHGCAVEVKTTGSKQPQRLIINSERQLDSTGVKALFLFCLSVDVRDASGETLNALVDSIRADLAEDVAVRDLFDDQLMEAGYLPLHTPLYEKLGYTIRDTGAFHVQGNFPRIVESDLRPGVGDVAYSIAVSECTAYAVADNALHDAFSELNHE